MSETPEQTKAYLTDEQWAILAAQEDKRTKMYADQVREQVRFQAKIAEALAEVIPSKSSLTDRDHFAMSALNGIIAHNLSDGSDFLHDLGPGAAAMWAYRFADAMLKARGE